MLDVLNVDRRYCAQNVLVLTDIRYFQNLLQRSPVVRTFNRDGSGFITILHKDILHVFMMSPQLIVIWQISQKNSASSYLNISFGWRYIRLALKRRI